MSQPPEDLLLKQQGFQFLPLGADNKPLTAEGSRCSRMYQIDIDFRFCIDPHNRAIIHKNSPGITESLAQPVHPGASTAKRIVYASLGQRKQVNCSQGERGAIGMQMGQNGELSLNHPPERLDITRSTDDQGKPTCNNCSKAQHSMKYFPVIMPLTGTTFTDPAPNKRTGFVDGMIEAPDLPFMLGKFPNHIANQLLKVMKKIDPMIWKHDLNGRVHENVSGNIIRFQL